MRFRHVLVPVVFAGAAALASPVLAPAFAADHTVSSPRNPDDYHPGLGTTYIDNPSDPVSGGGRCQNLATEIFCGTAGGLTTVERDNSNYGFGLSDDSPGFGRDFDRN